MRIAIIDDEPLAIQLLALHAQRIPGIRLVGQYTSATEALANLCEQPVDLVFLDIQMPGLSGIELAKRLPPQTMVIFTTAFDRYAVESYTVGAVHYLLKPISFEDFSQAVSRAKERMSASSSHSEDSFFYVRTNHKQERVLLRDVLYIEGLKDYVKIYMRQGHLVTLMNMKKLEDFLPRPQFMRVHRSFIAHISLATGIDRRNIYYGERSIPVSDSYRDAVTEYLTANSPQ